VADGSVLRGRALTWLGRPAAAAELLTAAADTIADMHPAPALEMLCEAQVPLWLAGDPERSRAVNDQALLLARTHALPFSERQDAMVALGLVLAGATSDGRTRIDAAKRRLGAACAAEHVADRRTAMLVLAQSQIWSGQLEPAQRQITIVIEQLRGQGAPSLLALALAVRSECEFRLGRWSASYADAVESLQWAEEFRQNGARGLGLLALARVEAGRGERGACEERIAQARRELGPDRIGLLSVWEPAVLGLAALAAGDPDAAVEHLEEAWRAAGGPAQRNPDVVPFTGDLAEAHARTGDSVRAQDLIAWMEERAQSTGLLLPELAARRCRGLLADRSDSDFEAARQLADRARLPFECGRALLCQGEVMRRSRRSIEARAALREANRIFDGLGARAWADRAATELAAAGARCVPAPERHYAELDELTPQELQVARMIAAGKNNGQTAASLFISRKTVEAHLTRVYRKLGIHSRTELTRVVLTCDPDAV